MVFKKKRKYTKKNSQEFEEDYDNEEEPTLDSNIKRGIIIVSIITFGAISLLSLFGVAGIFGIYLAKVLTSIFGWGRFFFPFIMFFLGYYIYNEGKYIVNKLTYVGIGLFIISLHAILHLFIPIEEWKASIAYGAGGGYLGYFLALVFYKALDIIGAWVILLSMLMSSIMIIFNTPLKSLVGSSSPLGFLFSPFKHAYRKLFDNKDELVDEDEYAGEEILDIEEPNSEELFKKYDNDLLDKNFSAKEISNNSAIKLDKPTTPQISPITETKEFDVSLNSIKVKIDLPINLLKAGASKPMSGDIKSNTEIITRTLENFGIVIEMQDITVGPTVTQYAFKPADGVKLSRITALRDDLALALAAHPIRIEAPIPGKALVGIEIPNHKKALVSLKEILTDPAFKKSDSPLCIGLGKDVAGKVWVDNLAKMPHVIVAGATNSGKSVCLNTIIVSLLYRNNPNELRFIMVDPKRVELTVYNAIPHLLTPVITDISKTINALKWCLNEMDRRFEILSKKGKRNIQAYNEGLKNSDDKMPYIVLVIDELADLMVSAKRDVEAAIIRLAQMARAVGIHLILATQRPSTDVITGLIKANTPARIAFAVASGIDSRTILDSIGAEDLLGQGDMLISTPAISQPKRLQGAYLSDIEIKRIVRYIREQVDYETCYIDEIIETQDVRGVGAINIGSSRSHDDKGDDGGDALFNEAKELVINTGKASASLLQRRLSVGYARAARIMDLLEESGTISQANGSKPREILISRQDHESTTNIPTSFTPLHNRNKSVAPQSYLDDDDQPDYFSEEEPETPIVLKGTHSYITPENTAAKLLDDEENEDENESKDEEFMDDSDDNKSSEEITDSNDIYEEEDEDNKIESKEASSKLQDIEDDGKYYSK